jgi:dTDP-4-dehydrorhamnose 3,5-epimerase
MIYEPTALAGVVVVRPEPHADERGAFWRAWCGDELAAHGLDARLVQASLSTNTRKGTLRGMHWSVAPHAEAKVVRCVRGAIHDVALDLRRESPTFRRWHAVTLTRDNGLALFVPEGVAHGFQTLEDESDVLYMITERYDPTCARGARHDDPAFGIRWPLPVSSISARDAAYEDFR